MMPRRQRTPPPVPRAAVHVFRSSGETDLWQRPICECGSVETARVHDVPDVDGVELDERRTGERE